jgi:molybdenum cofactor synthesis domain-containing protein
MSDIITAVILIVGNEILSGRTQDLNINYIAKQLDELGISLKEARVIADHETTIINTTRELSNNYDYVFVTGGIGPTHDDITVDAIAKTFNVPLLLNATAAYNIKQYYYQLEHGEERFKASIKMAYIPQGATLINNRVSGAPGFVIHNVYVMAGIPHIMHAMFDEIKKDLKTGPKTHSRSITAMIGESFIAQELANLQLKHPDLEIGSYPFSQEGKWGTSLVIRGRDLNEVNIAYDKLYQIIKATKDDIVVDSV